MSTDSAFTPRSLTASEYIRELFETRGQRRDPRAKSLDRPHDPNNRQG